MTQYYNFSSLGFSLLWLTNRNYAYFLLNTMVPCYGSALLLVVFELNNTIPCSSVPLASASHGWGNRNKACLFIILFYICSYMYIHTYVHHTGGNHTRSARINCIYIFVTKVLYVNMLFILTH